MVADMEVDKVADIFADVVADKKKKNELSDMELDMVADMEVDKVWPTWRPTCSKA